MLSVSVIKLLFIAGGIIFCLLVSMGFKSDTKRHETASEALKKIQDQRNELLKKDKEQ